MNHDIDSLREQLRKLGALHAGGAIGDEAYHGAKAELERRLVDLVLSATPAAAGAAVPGPSRRLVALLVALVLVVAIGGYAWTGSPGYEQQAAAVSAAQAPTADAAQVNAMADQLIARLKDKPDDAQGWAMLGRATLMLGRHDESVAALQKALALQGEDAKLLADLADALAMKNGRSLQGEPTKLIERALAIDPGSVKALALAGSAAFDRKDFAAAVAHWEKLVRSSPGDADFVRQIQAGIAEAREQGKLPPGSAAASAAAPASVSGTVTLSGALAAQAQPNDTLFIFARAAEGPRMPLVILRKQVKDLPLQFTLDDSLAMSPALKLSSFAKIVVTARISKSGQALPEAGDLQGQSGPVDVGAAGVRVDIGEVVGPNSQR